MDWEVPTVDGLTETGIIKEVYPLAKIIIVAKSGEEPYRKAA